MVPSITEEGISKLFNALGGSDGDAHDSAQDHAEHSSQPRMRLLVNDDEINLINIYGQVPGRGIYKDELSVPDGDELPLGD